LFSEIVSNKLISYSRSTFHVNLYRFFRVNST